MLHNTVVPGSVDEATLPTLPRDARLDSWKEVAAYLKRDVTTVQRWEKREGMPVHRHLHDKLGSVYAFRAELDAWAEARVVRAERDRTAAGPADVLVADRRRLRIYASIIVGLILASSIAILVGARVRSRRTEEFLLNAFADAQVQSVTNFDGLEQAAAMSRDGQFAAFLSDRDGRMDVWITRIGSGEAHNLTGGTAPELVNPSVRTLGFTPNGEAVTFWVRRPDKNGAPHIGIWSIGIFGGAAAPYVDDAAEVDWSSDGSRLAFHTAGPGDPLFVVNGPEQRRGAPIFTAPVGLHAHFPLWSADRAFLYFVQGALPDKLDIWRIKSSGGTPERITNQNGRVSHPVHLDDRTLAYLATDPDGSGPWLYCVDVERRIPHRLTTGLEKYTSLSADANGDRLLVTVARDKHTLWRLPVTVAVTKPATPTPISLANGNSRSPRAGPNALVYVSSVGRRESVWRLDAGGPKELWGTAETEIIGAPAVSLDGQEIALSVRTKGRPLLYTMRMDGTAVRLISDALALQGAPAWTPDGRSITTAIDDHGTPRLVAIPLDGSEPMPIVREYSMDPVWSADGAAVVYSGPDIGTTFQVKAAIVRPSAKPLAPFTLTRGARHLAFFPGRHALVMMRGEIQHKNLWLLDLDTGKEQPLTNLGPDFNVVDFDLSKDGREIVLERMEQSSDVMMLALRRGR